jgi:hypothetical protein
LDIYAPSVKDLGLVARLPIDFESHESLLGRRFIYLDFSRGGLICQNILDEQRSSILSLSL